MSKQRVIDDVSSLIYDVLELNNDGRLRDVPRDSIDEWDSLAHLRIFMAIENKYAVNVPIEDIFSVETIEDIGEIVLQHFIERDTNL